MDLQPAAATTAGGNTGQLKHRMLHYAAGDLPFYYRARRRLHGLRRLSLLDDDPDLSQSPASLHGMQWRGTVGGDPR